MPSTYDHRTKRWKRHTTYSIWYGMLSRCYNEDHESYSDYGGRGIKVSDRWRPSHELPAARAFANFLVDMGHRPSAQHSLDRRDANKDYSRDNCKWATAIEQGRNKRTTLYVYVDKNYKVHNPLDTPEFLERINSGELQRIPVAQLTEIKGLKYQQLRYQLRKEGTWPGDTFT